MRFAILLACIVWVVGLCAIEGAALGADDAIFADGFGADACDGCGEGGDPPLVCEPSPELVYPFGYTPAGLAWGGTQPYFLLPEVGGDQLTQIKFPGGLWKSFTFTWLDMPAPTTEMNADTSNPGPQAIGADVRYWAISECDGDFRPVPGCHGFVNEGPFAYVDFARLGVPGTCQLDPARTYALNIHMGPSPCNSTRPGSCGFRIALR